MFNQRVDIIYYTGTRGTMRVAEAFEKSFKAAEYTTNLQRLIEGANLTYLDHALTVLIFPVHSFCAPEPVYKWIESLPPTNRKPAVVISVSGGGEMTGNTACRHNTIKMLEIKGYSVFYEDMIVMPSNCIIPTKLPIAKLLLEVMPQKVDVIVADLIRGKAHRTKPKIIDYLIARIGENEKKLTSRFGKEIVVTDSCNGCGLCVKNCPANNITLIDDKAVFADKCQLCLSCIYICPQQALEQEYGRVMVVRDGYDLDALEELELDISKINIKKYTRGFVWSGVRRYLLEKRK